MTHYLVVHTGPGRLVSLARHGQGGRYTVVFVSEADPGLDSCLRRGDYSGSSHASDLNIGTPARLAL